MRHVGAKGLAHDDMPCRSPALICLLLDLGRDLFRSERGRETQRFAYGATRQSSSTHILLNLVLLLSLHSNLDSSSLHLRRATRTATSQLDRFPDSRAHDYTPRISPLRAYQPT